MSEQNDDDVEIRMPEPEVGQPLFECLPLGTSARIAQLERELEEAKDAITKALKLWTHSVVREQAATRRAEEAEHHLANLLAVIHRDGGHYQQAHGTNAAVSDAMKLSSERIAKMEEAEEAVKVLVEQVYEWTPDLESFRMSIAHNPIASAALAATVRKEGT